MSEYHRLTKRKNVVCVNKYNVAESLIGVGLFNYSSLVNTFLTQIQDKTYGSSSRFYFIPEMICCLPLQYMGAQS